MGAPAVPETGREPNRAELHFVPPDLSGRRTLLAAFSAFAMAQPVMLTRGPSPRTPTAPADVGCTAHSSRAFWPAD
jgi:hypothetical protein